MADIFFSPEEFSLILDHRMFDIKAGILSKITDLFSAVERDIRHQLESTEFDFPENISIRTGKISRGENYLNCPYLVLDYPRLFSKEDIFSFRTIFWWGHYFSNAFILGGNSYNQHISYLSDHPEKLKNTDWLLCVHHTPWKLELEKSNYVPIKTLREREISHILHRYKFLKIAKIYSLDSYDQLKTGSVEFITEILGVLG